MSAGRVDGCVAGASARAVETKAKASNAMQQAAFIVISEAILHNRSPLSYRPDSDGQCYSFYAGSSDNKTMPPTCADSVSTDTLAQTQAMSNLAENRAAIARVQRNLSIRDLPDDAEWVFGRDRALTFRD